MALDSFFYRVQEYDPFTPVWRYNDNRPLWMIYLAFDEIEDLIEMNRWLFHNFGSNDGIWEYKNHSDRSIVLYIYDIEKFVSFKMTWML